jgi:hypothetical protein
MINTDNTMPMNDTLVAIIYICLSADDCAINYAEQILKNDFNRQWFFSADRYVGLREELRNLLVPPSPTNVTEKFQCIRPKKQLENCLKNIKRCYSFIVDNKFEDGYCFKHEEIFMSIETTFKESMTIFGGIEESTQLDYTCNYTKCNENKLFNQLVNVIQQQYNDSYLMNMDFLTMTSLKTTRKPTRLTTSIPQKTDDFNQSSQYEEETEQVIKTTSFSYSLSINNNTTLKADATMIDYHRIYRLIAFFIAFYNI